MTPPTGGGGRAGGALDLVERVVIDGDNLLHAVRGGRDAGGVAWLLPRLRTWRPPEVEVMVVLDGHADRGLGDRRPIAPGIVVRHAGARTADDLIVWLMETRPYADRARTVVVTDDWRLRDRVRRVGAVGRPVAWLTNQLSGGERGGGEPGTTGGARPPVSIGRPRSGPAAGDDDGRGDERPSWGPGRGATRKSGNPKRAPRDDRRPRPR